MEFIEREETKFWTLEGRFIEREETIFRNWKGGGELNVSTHKS